MIKILIGGSPCTYWSVAQKSKRETTSSGFGWELFKNYVIAKDRFKPDFFLYENNWSASEDIKREIEKHLGLPLHYYNSSLVSAQSRERFYLYNWNCGSISDMGLVLNDVLDEDFIPNKTYELTDVCCTSGSIVKQKNLFGESICAYKSNNLIRIGSIRGGIHVEDRVYSPYGKSFTLTTIDGFTPKIFVKYNNNYDAEHVYTVNGGRIQFSGSQYPVYLEDGDWIIRDLSLVERHRLQTLPDDYCNSIDYKSAVKAIGNGWTAELITLLLSVALSGISRNENIVVCSMYDGIATGRYVLDCLGFNHVTYYAYEIDDTAISVALSHYPDIIECGDAFQVRDTSKTLCSR